jgi:beta-N-acetylhexosaminidase
VTYPHFHHANSSHFMAAILSLSGLTLTPEERALFEAHKPFGFILFGRNIESPAQLKALIADLKACVGWDCPILIDQEGGRVQRLKPPQWRRYKPFQSFGDKAKSDFDGALEDLRFETLRLSEELLDMGVNVNCSPVLDVLAPQTHDVIGDRAFADDAEMVGRLGLSVCRHYLKAGIVPVIKHIPGHGRGESDSHLELPRVTASHEDLSAVDFAPFKTLSNSDVGPYVWAMTAHILYEALDTQDVASASKTIIQDVIRGEIGFDGILLSDDLDMKALDVYGDVSVRAEKCLDAGCDLALYCSGDLEPMKKLCESVPNLRVDTLRRLQTAADSAIIAA